MDARTTELDRVRIIEVGARRGLQSQIRALDPIVRMNLVELLELAGLREVEVGAFISPRWVPQLADTSTVFDLLGGSQANRIRSAMVPNLQGLEMAVAAGCRDITVATAATDAYCRANLNCNIAESLRRADEISGFALGLGIQVRATLSAVIDCPFTGPVTPAEVVRKVKQLHDMGCREISLIDSTGTGTPASIGTLLRACVAEVPVKALACHFHDTFGLGIANVVEALEHGVRAFDTAISGLGGNTHFPGAAGSLATEDIAYLMTELGIQCGLDMDGLLLAADYIDVVLERRTESRVGRALRARRKHRVRSQDMPST